MTLRFEYHDAFQPYTRMTRRGKYVHAAAQAYLDSQMRLKLAFQAQMQAAGREPLPARAPLAVRLRITRASRMHTRDLDNEVKAVLDALNGIAFPDDRWIDDLQARRVLGDEDGVVVTVEALG